MKLYDVNLTNWDRYGDKTYAQVLFTFNGEPLGMLVHKGESVDSIIDSLKSLIQKLEQREEENNENNVA